MKSFNIFLKIWKATHMHRAVCVFLAFTFDQEDLHKPEMKTKTAVNHLPEPEGIPNTETHSPLANTGRITGSRHLRKSV